MSSQSAQVWEDVDSTAYAFRRRQGAVQPQSVQLRQGVPVPVGYLVWRQGGDLGPQRLLHLAGTLIRLICGAVGCA